MYGEHFSPVSLHDVSVVAAATDFQVRREQGEEPQFGEHVSVGFQTSVDEHARLMRIGDDLLDDAEPTLGIEFVIRCPRAPFAKHSWSIVQMPFVVEKGFAIRDEILQVANLRPIHGRIVDFVENAFGDRKPNPTQSGIGGPNSVFVAALSTGVRFQDRRGQDYFAINSPLRFFPRSRLASRDGRQQTIWSNGVW